MYDPGGQASEKLRNWAGQGWLGVEVMKSAGCFEIRRGEVQGSHRHYRHSASCGFSHLQELKKLPKIYVCGTAQNLSNRHFHALALLSAREPLKTS